MKFFTKHLFNRNRNNNNRPVNARGPLTYGSLQVWTTLPSGIRDDPVLSSFRTEYECIPGKNQQNDHQISSFNDGTSSPNQSTSHSLHSSNIDQIDLATINDDNNTSTRDNMNEAKNVNKRQLLSPIHKVLNSFKVVVLVAIWILFTAILMAKDEKLLAFQPISVPPNDYKSYGIVDLPSEPRIGVHLSGAFADEPNNSTNFLFIRPRLLRNLNGSDKSSSNVHIESISDIFKLSIVENVNNIDRTPQVERVHTFNIGSELFEQIKQNETMLDLEITSNLEINFPINLAYDPTPIDKTLGTIYAAIILFGLYAMIISEIVDRIFAGMIASTTAIATLALMNDRPTMPEILSWIDVETLLLLFGMMTLVAVLAETGIFDYLAVLAFKLTRGQVWPLINCLCLFTAVVSAFLDNVTTLLLICPVSFRLCEVMKLNPVPILMSMIIFSNIGGAITPIGDPPNIIVASNPTIVANGVDFLTFSTHMAAGIVLVMIQTYIHLRYKFRVMSGLRSEEPEVAQQLRQEIANWEQTAQSLSSTSNDESLVRDRLENKINQLRKQLKKHLSSGKISNEIYEQTLNDLQQKYPIRNRVLLLKCFVALAFVLVCFFSHSLPGFKRLSLGWTALLGALLLLILADRKSIEPILAHVEWSTLLFFAVLFVLMESLARLGLIARIGGLTENIILSVSEEFRLTVAILIILWVSAIVSAFVDNIPLTTMMIRIVISLAEKKVLNLPLQPLTWALSFGACLGGNGTIIGASANIVAISVARKYGYRITFFHFFKVAFPAMLGSLVVASLYLIVCHVHYTWH